MTPAFVFFHVGADIGVPTLLVQSIRAMHSQSEVIQCSDAGSPAVAGVDAVRRFEGDSANLMTFRLACFAALERCEPAIYLDTDMLCVRPVNPAMILGDHDVGVCKREFDRLGLFNPEFKGLDLSEYRGRAMIEVYPYVACATITASSAFWADCFANLITLPPKFHCWYGDQEAIRNVVNAGKYKVTLLPETVYGCLPESQGSGPRAPRLLHFKGEGRKAMMFDYVRRLRIA